MKNILIVMILVVNLINTCFGDLLMNKHKENGYLFFTIQNKFFDIELTSSGGRIYSLKVFPSGKELLYVAPGHGGALDDRAGRTTADYDFTVLKNTTDKVIINFRNKSDYGLSIEKQIAVRKDSPVIKVDYKLINESDMELSYQHMFRNFIAVGDGIKVNKADYIYYHDMRGAQELDWPLQWFTKTRSEVKVADKVGNWQAAVARKDKTGIIYYADEIKSLYFWSKAGSCGYGTIEPTFPAVTLEPGEEKSFSVLCVPFEGLPGITSMTKDYLLYLNKQAKGLALELTTEFMPLSGVFAKSQNVEVLTQLLDLERKSVAETTVTLQASLQSAVSTATSSLSVSTPGEYIISQKIKVGNTVLGSYETPVKIELPETYVSQYYDPSYKPEKEMMNCSISADDLKDGYFVASLEKKENISIENIDSDLGIGEEEFTGIELYALTDLGKVELSLDKGDFTGKTALFVKDDKWLKKADSLTIQRGDKNKIYIWCETSNIKAGKYKLTLKIQPEKSNNRNVTLNFHVHPVSCPSQRKLQVSLFHSSLPDIFTALYPSLPEDQWLRIWSKCLDDYKRLGVNYLVIRHYTRDRFAEKTTKVIKFEKGYLPVLDLTKWNPYFDMARKTGMKHIRIAYGWTARCWLPEGYKSFSKEKQEEINLFVLKQIYDFLVQKGFESFYYYCIDEISPDAVDNRISYMSKIRKLIPEMDFGASGLSSLNREQMQKLAPYLIWISPYSVEFNVFRILNKGNIDLLPNAVIGTQSQVDVSTYAEARLSPWYVWKRDFGGIQMYSYTGFTKNHTWCAVSPGKDRPVWSIGLAGLLDGLEDYEYLMMLEDKMQILRKENKTAQADNIQKALDKFVGNEEEKLFSWKYVTRQSFIFPEIGGTLSDIKQAKRTILELLEK